MAVKKSKILKQPHLPPSPSSNSKSIETPKGRSQSRTRSSAIASSSTSSSTAPHSKGEGHQVGEVRKKVEKMSHRDQTPSPKEEDGGGEEDSMQHEEVNVKGKSGAGPIENDNLEKGTIAEEGDQDDMQLDGKKAVGGTPIAIDADPDHAPNHLDRPESRQTMQTDDSSRPLSPLQADAPPTVQPTEEDKEMEDGASTAQHGTKRKMVVRTPSSVPLDGEVEGAKKMKESGEDEVGRWRGMSLSQPSLMCSSIGISVANCHTRHGRPSSICRPF